MNRNHPEDGRRLGIQSDIESDPVQMVVILDRSGFSKIFASRSQYKDRRRS